MRPKSEISASGRGVRSSDHARNTPPTIQDESTGSAPAELRKNEDSSNDAYTTDMDSIRCMLYSHGGEGIQSVIVRS